MPVCDCGAYTARYIVHTESPDGTRLKQSYTSCPECRPAEFATAAFAPLDRIVTGPEAMPDKYKLCADGFLRPTDELMQDTADMVNSDGPSSKAAKIKRAKRRTAPMSESEIAQAVAWGERVVAPILREQQIDHALRSGGDLPKGML